jgi:DNA repair protein RadD
MTVVLHNHQNNLKRDLYNEWNTGARNVLAVLPTGGGKSVVKADVVLDHQKAGQKSAVIAHRNELVTQMSVHMARRGVYHRIIGADTTISQAVRKHRKEFGQSFINPSAPTGVIGVDTLISRQADEKDWIRQIDLWSIDEAHHTIGNWEVDENGSWIYQSNGDLKWNVDPNKWGKAVGLFINARGAGYTATPQRADGQGLGWLYDGVFHSMVQGPSMRWLIENGFLADYEMVCPLSDLRMEENPTGKDGDWSNSALRKAAKKSHIVGDVVMNYAMYALGRRAIVFATDVETADNIAKKFNEFGIRAASVNGNSLTAYREQCINEFASGALQVLINVDLFDEGFDVPACDVVIMARPTASLGKYLQMVGRALRWMEGKIALIIDHVSNVIRHGLPDKFRVWSLERREKRAKHKLDPDEIELTTCKNCRRPYEKFRTCCPYCGQEKPLPSGGGRSVEMVEGDLILLDRATLERMRIATVLESAADVGNKVASVAGPIAGKGAANRQVEKIRAHTELTDAIAQWAALERLKGYNDREIHRRFYMTLGVDVLSAMNASQTRKELEVLRDHVRSWYGGGVG